MTKDQIKQISLQLFAEHGYEGTSLAEIAKQVGIKKPSIYAYFTSKKDLFLTIFSEVIAEHVEYTDQLIKTMSQETVDKKLYRILTGACFYYLESEVKVTFLKRIMLFPPHFLAEQLREKFLTTEQNFSKLLAQIFQSGIDQGLIPHQPMEGLLTSYYCLLDGIFVQNFYYGTEQLKQKLPHIWKIYWTGITHVDRKEH